MGQSELIKETYRRKQTGFGALSDNHKLQVNLHEWSVDDDHVEFSGDDFPYIRMALLDRWLDDNAERIPPLG